MFAKLQDYHHSIDPFNIVGLRIRTASLHVLQLQNLVKTFKSMYTCTRNIQCLLTVPIIRKIVKRKNIHAVKH